MATRVCSKCGNKTPESMFYTYVRDKKRYMAGYCNVCHLDRRNRYFRTWYRQDPEKLKRFNKRPTMSNFRSLKNNQLRMDCYNAYGGPTCCWCGEDDFDVLVMDHIENDGADQRKKHPDQHKRMYYWLKKQNYPPGFQVLCHNCNLAKVRNGGVLPQNRLRIILTPISLAEYAKGA